MQYIKLRSSACTIQLQTAVDNSVEITFKNDPINTSSENFSCYVFFTVFVTCICTPAPLYVNELQY